MAEVKRANGSEAGEAQARLGEIVGRVTWELRQANERLQIQRDIFMSALAVRMKQDAERCGDTILGSARDDGTAWTVTTEELSGADGIKIDIDGGRMTFRRTRRPSSGVVING